MEVSRRRDEEGLITGDEAPESIVSGDDAEERMGIERCVDVGAAGGTTSNADAMLGGRSFAIALSFSISSVVQMAC